MQRCLGIRSVVGRNGYEYLRKLKFPLPSYRTLCRRIQGTPFTPGIQHDVLQWLKLKMETKKESEKLCVLLVDEMQLKPRVELDKGLHKVVGYVSTETLPADSPPSAEKEIASHALVFMLRGLTASWKQTVAYLFTGSSIKREPFWEFAKKVIDASESAGFRIQCVTSDMGPANTGLWGQVGIESSRNKLASSIPHPCCSERKLYFAADPPHLLKNLWSCVLAHRITLHEEIVQKYNLPSNVVTGIYVQQLMDQQNCQELRLAHKLQQCHVSPTQYEKMRVCFAAQFFSRSTAAAIVTCVNLNLLPPEALTTAWFLDFVNSWFDAMNARHRDAALFRGQRKEILHDMLSVVKSFTSFSGKKSWKPIQTGIQLSTTVVLQLSQDIMSAYNLQYFLTGRLSQDPVENLFSQARGQGVMHPSCLVFRQALRLVTIAQFLHLPKGSAYEEDGCGYLIDYLESRSDGTSSIDETSLLQAMLSLSSNEDADGGHDDNKMRCQDTSDVEPDSSPEENIFVSEQMEEVINSTSTSTPLRPVENVFQPVQGLLQDNAMYDVLGWAVSTFFKKVTCDDCRAAFVADSTSDECRGMYTTVRSFGSLKHPSKELLAAGKLAEEVFSASKSTLHRTENVHGVIVKQVVDVLDSCNFDFPQCHNALQSIMKKYIHLRINEHANTITCQNTSMKRQFGSKTAYRITLAP